MKVSILLVMLAFIVACKQDDDAAKPNEYAEKYVREFNQVDSFHVPLGKKDTIEKFERWLGLKSLRNGSDSIHIRFVYEVALFPEFVMAELKHDGKKWVGEISRITTRFNEEKAEVDTMTRAVVLDNPKSGWVEFISQLFDLKVFSIQDFSYIPKEDRASVMDGDAIYIEVATSGSYHSYGYPNADMQNEKYWQVVNINKIKNLLYDEFKMLDRFDKAIEDDLKKSVKRSLQEMGEKRNKNSKKIKIQEMQIEDVRLEDTSPQKKKKGR